MNSRTSIIAVVITIGVAVILGFVFAKHQPVFSPSANALPDSKSVQEMKQRFLNGFRDIQGTIKSITATTDGKIFAIETSIPNVSTLGVSGRDMTSMVAKTVKVLVTGKTLIGDSSPFSVGDTVETLLDKSVYFGTEFEALTISHYSRDQEIKKVVAYSDIIHGTITSIAKSSLMVKADVTDLLKVAALDVSGSFTVPRITKSYRIFVTATTSFSGSSFASFKTGDSVTVWGSGNLLDKSSFTATRLRLEK